MYFWRSASHARSCFDEMHICRCLSQACQVRLFLRKRSILAKMLLIRCAHFFFSRQTRLSDSVTTLLLSFAHANHDENSSRFARRFFLLLFCCAWRESICSCGAKAARHCNACVIGYFFHCCVLLCERSQIPLDSMNDALLLKLETRLLATRCARHRRRHRLRAS